MIVYQFTCHGTACERHCAENILVSCGGPRLPTPGTELSAKTKETLIGLAQRRMCPDIKPVNCTVTTKSRLTVYAELVSDELSDAGLSDATQWVEAILRDPQSVAAVVWDAMRSIGNEEALVRLIDSCAPPSGETAFSLA